MKQDFVDFSVFENLDIRVGTIISCVINTGLKNPAYAMKIDFGPYGIKSTSAQLSISYSSEELIGKQVIAITNFHKKKIGKIWSEALVLGLVRDNSKEVILAIPDKPCENGLQLL